MSAVDDELRAWLGPANDDLTEEQIETLAEQARDIAARYPDPDEQPEREAAMATTVQFLLDEIDPRDVARTLIAARAEERRAYVTAEQAAVLLHRLDGVPKARAADSVGISRMSLLKALGER